MSRLCIYINGYNILCILQSFLQPDWTMQKKSLVSGFAAAHHLLVRGETYGHPAVCVCTHLVLHIRPDATIAQEVVARLRVAPWLAIPVHIADEDKRNQKIITDLGGGEEVRKSLSSHGDHSSSEPLNGERTSWRDMTPLT